MKNTIWIRPTGAGDFLVYESIDDLEEVFKDMFDSDDFYYFRKCAERELVILEYYDEKDMDNYGKATIDVDGGYKEQIEYKWVKMSESDIENLGEFTGW